MDEELLRQRLTWLRGRVAWVELRLDDWCASDPELIPRLRSLHGAFPEFQWLATCRFAARKEDQVALLEAAAAAGWEAVDLPLELQDPVRLPDSTLRIHSWHQEEAGEVDLHGVLQELHAKCRPQDLVKVVAWAEHAEDAWPALDLYRAGEEEGLPPERLLAFAQGPGGTASRCLALRCGAPWIYCAWPGEQTAPGQLSLPEAEALLPAGLSAETPILGVVGLPVEHSLSPQLWSKATPSLYLRFPVQDLPPFLAGAARFGVGALSITAPHKQAAFRAAASASPVAEACQAANLLTATADSPRQPSGDPASHPWHADHTDGSGALRALHDAGLGDAASILLLGAGGAAHAVAAAAQRRGHPVTFASRRPPEPGLAGVPWVPLHEVDPASFQAVIQATPVGSLHHPGLLCAGHPPHAGAFALDMVYHPPVTSWMQQAEDAGAIVLTGLSMLVHQMLAQCARVFPDLEPPNPEDLEDHLRAHLQERAPVILIGMPGSGKSTFGKALAATLGRTFLDADEVLAARHGRSLTPWIQQDPDGFRTAEAALFRELAQTPNAVLATGGGVVTRKESVRLLAQAERVVQLTCSDATLLARNLETPRPHLLEGDMKVELQNLFEQRASAYAQAADLVISTNEGLDSGVREVIRCFGLKGFGPGFR